MFGGFTLQLAVLLSFFSTPNHEEKVFLVLLGNKMNGIQLLMILLVSHSSGNSLFSVVKQNLMSFFLPERAENGKQKPACLWEGRETYSRDL